MSRRLLVGIHHVEREQWPWHGVHARHHVVGAEAGNTHTAKIATTHGLDSITVGSLATATGLSKSGILTVFGTREAIQVAAVAEARQIYRETVIAPVWGNEPGKPRLRTLMDSRIAYLHEGVFPGGCFS